MNRPRFLPCLTLGVSLTLAAVASAPPPAAGAVQAQPAASGVEALVDSLMADYATDETPGGVVGVIRNGEVAFAKGYGMADLTHGIPNTPETKFNLGSGAKQFMAYAFALLESQGRLSLDDPVSEYLPDWPEFEQTVTLRHLLSHTSGYREAYGTLTLAGRIPGRDYLPREEALEVVRRQPQLEFPAGSEWKYNSTAFVILAEIASKVVARSSADWMRDNVFDPLGMDETVIESRVGQVIPGAAYSYAGSRERSYRMEWSNRAIFGAAEVYTTVGDLAKWFRNFHAAELGGPAVMGRMTERFVLTSGDTTDYALGLSVDTHRGLRRVEHGGSHAGYRAQLTFYPELNAGVVVITNYGGVNAGRVANEVAEFAFAEHMAPEGEMEAEARRTPAELPTEPVSLDSARLASYEGSYRMEGGGVRHIAQEGGRLRVGGELTLVPVSDSVFRAEGPPVTVIFHHDAEGVVTGGTVWEGDESTPIRRVDSWDPTPEELEAYTGRYYSPELETIYTFRVEEGRLVSEHRWNGLSRYRPVQPDEFEGQQGPDIHFERNRVGLITGYYASVGRTEDVWFEKRD